MSPSRSQNSTTSRFTGRILGAGSASGTRVVLGWWRRTPFGDFADVMVERADGHRVLLAPTAEVRDFVAATYQFDECRLESVDVVWEPGAVRVTTPSLTLGAQLGRRSALGWLLRAVPRPLATSTRLSIVTDPVARIFLRGVRTRGTAGGGRREFYGATDVRRVTGLSATFDGEDLGSLRPVWPPTRFGFSSTPRTPSVTEVTTTVVHQADGNSSPAPADPNLRR